MTSRTDGIASATNGHPQSALNACFNHSSILSTCAHYAQPWPLTAEDHQSNCHLMHDKSMAKVWLGSGVTHLVSIVVCSRFK